MASTAGAYFPGAAYCEVRDQRPPIIQTLSWLFMASNGQLLPIMGATPHKLIILSFLWSVRTE